MWGVPQYFYGILEFYDPAEFFGSISGGILELTLEMPLANICEHGDVRVPTRDVVMKCCRKVGLKVEKFEIRKGMRMHCVVRKV